MDAFTSVDLSFRSQIIRWEPQNSNTSLEHWTPAVQSLTHGISSNPRPNEHVDTFMQQGSLVRQPEMFDEDPTE